MSFFRSFAIFQIVFMIFLILYNLGCLITSELQRPPTDISEQFAKDFTQMQFIQTLDKTSSLLIIWIFIAVIIKRLENAENTHKKILHKIKIKS